MLAGGLDIEVSSLYGARVQRNVGASLVFSKNGGARMRCVKTDLGIDKFKKLSINRILSVCFFYLRNVKNLHITIITFS
jgi:hypothetical protein